LYYLIRRKNKMIEDYNFDGECTCGLIEWEPNEDGFFGCPFCEMWDGFEEDE